jgi:hypothetical protein
VADQREAILSRLVAVCGAAEGIVAVGRNRLDVPGLSRPAIIVHDAIEEMRDAAPNLRFSELQRMELSPAITIILRGGSNSEAGPLLSLYRSRIVAAILNDAELRAAVGTTGTINGIRYQGCFVAPPDAEAKEHRIDIHIVFTYAFKIDDLAA